MFKRILAKIGAFKALVAIEIAYLFALLTLKARWRVKSPGVPHKLGAPLILSLTSYKKRFPTLHLTLRCLMTQSIKPDIVVLWISRDDAAYIPSEVLDIQQTMGLLIRQTDDIRSFKKIIPSLIEWPDAFIVTADDDAYYPRNWLKELVEKSSGSNTIVCHRARDAKSIHQGKLELYAAWKFASSETTATTIFPTGVGGVLYPPGSLHPEVIRQEIFMELCPEGDDIWLAWMGRLANSRYRLCRQRGEFVTWKESHASSLWYSNLTAGKNDVQIQNMILRYGPLTSPKIPSCVTNK